MWTSYLKRRWVCSSRWTALSPSIHRFFLLPDDKRRVTRAEFLCWRICVRFCEICNLIKRQGKETKKAVDNDDGFISTGHMDGSSVFNFVVTVVCISAGSRTGGNDSPIVQRCELHQCAYTATAVHSVPPSPARRAR